jgi:hypothetical protein
MLIFSGMTINIATHFCNGSFIGTKVSFSGKLASCGMEKDNTVNAGYGIHPKHSCSDITSSYTMSSNYIPGSPDLNSGKMLVQIPVIHVNFILSELIAADCQDAFKIEPPGFHNPSSVDQEVICIYRI